MYSFYKLRDPGLNVRQAHSGQPDGQSHGTLSPSDMWGIKYLASMARKSFSRMSRWYRRRTEIHRLKALTGYHLKDIGLDRFPIASSLQELVEREIRLKSNAGKHHRYR
ncbi:MAG: DUF1127 domain-containing protein [Sneathiella sp.]|nr:DUF1127 domain-containing protein [Sneathiella sp.]